MAKSEISAWMPIYIKRFFSSPQVQAMRDFQKWWYMALLLRAWQSDPPCHLPADDEQLRILAGAPPLRAWREHGKLVTDCFSAVGDSGQVANQDQLEIYHRQLAGLDKKSEHARIAAEARWGKAGNARGMPEQCSAMPYASNSSSTEPRVSVSKKEPTKEPKPIKHLELPVWIPEKVWMDFELMRGKLRKPMTDRARELITAKLKRFMDQGHNPVEILENSITGGWQDVYEPRSNGNGRSQRAEPSKTEQREQRANETAERLRKKFFPGADVGDGGVPQQAHGDPERRDVRVDLDPAPEYLPPERRR